MRRLPAKLRAVLLPQPGWVALACAIALACLGVAAIDTVQPGYAAIQARWLGIALVVGALCVIPHPRTLGNLTFPLMGAVMLLLLVLVVPGVPRSLVPVRNGITAWMSLGFMMFQVSELAKIVFVLALARYLRHNKSYRTLGGLLVPFAIMFVPVFLILVEPDLGTALLFAPALFAVLVAAGAKLKHLGMLAGLALLAVALNVAAIYVLPDKMQLLAPHQRMRIVAMISQAQGDNRYIKDFGYQQNKSMALIGSGGMRGYGKERAATIVAFNRLPEDHNDMIFAVIGNRWGWRGCALTLGLFGLMILSLLLVAGRSKDPYARLSVVGFAALLLTQILINVGMAVGLLPIIGITLPFVSYGGSSLVGCFAMIGLSLNFATQRPAIINQPSFEFDRARAVAG